MADKIYLDIEGLKRLKDYIDSNFRNISDDVIKPGQGIIIANDGTISIADNYTNSIIAQTNEAAARASQSAVVAGNYAAQAIQAKTAIDNKIWYGTIEEYNALEQVSSSKIYIILHE